MCARCRARRGRASTTPGGGAGGRARRGGGWVINTRGGGGGGGVARVGVIGDDGEGHELLQALRLMRGVALDGVARSRSRRTPTYTKPMLSLPGQPPRELNRLDIHPRSP